MEKSRGIGFFLIFFTFILIFPASCYSLKKYCKIFLPNNVSLTAELAITPEDRQRGLMFRDSIQWDEAMLFIFEEEERQAFWMKNMRFPIDILWLDRDKRVVHIEQDVPPCKRDPCPSYSPLYPALFVLELKAGSVEKHQLKLFDRVEFILPVKSTKE